VITEPSPKNKDGLFVERAHLPFVVGAFVIATLGGFALPLLLDGYFRGVSASFVEHAQVHGHLQAVGFAGFFIVGVSYRVGPRFGRNPLAYPYLVAPSFYLLGGGVLARFVGQPVADVELFGALMALSGWLELAGIGCFAAITLATMAPARGRDDVSAWLFSVGALWFLVQGVLNAVWLTELWQDGNAILPGDRGAAILLILFFGMHLSFIFGVALRTFPVFFAVELTRPGPQHLAVVLGQVGLALAAIAAVVDVSEGPRPWSLEAVGLILLGAALIWLTTFTGWWRSPVRLRPSSQPFALTLQLAMAWTTVAGLLLIGYAARAIVEGEAIEFATMDAVRHIVGLSVVTTAIVGIAQLILLEFAGERLRAPPSAWHGTGLGLALAIATALRAGARLFDNSLSSDATHLLMAIAGAIAFGVIVLAYYFQRALRGLKDIVQLAESRMRSAGVPPEPSGDVR
jgi:hypothetical protein